MIWLYIMILNIICALLLYDNIMLDIKLDKAKHKLKKRKRCSECQQ